MPKLTNNCDGVEHEARVTYVPPYDEVLNSGVLRIEILDSAGLVVGDFSIAADSITTDDDSRSIHAFAHNVDEEVRKKAYLEKYPLSAGYHNHEMVLNKIRQDHAEWSRRSGRARSE